ncbi:CCA tRNA nucleotidyltransferase [Allorhizobium sp. BGMRC 0089]|uniref:CCA tRNA nucleotidyltransferase n=1 Tax=Allorhizobium sonneratiae TaxID=2934936 RepID=UPI0020347F31|nr:CCA tRNA nucleotidyltransferase [Allorhizobium sonneratiae]MCM2291199.1 CCA tRNA nucleotidyltransferase [Allorhizobium sonneratiae]
MISVADQPWFQDPALKRIFTLLNDEHGEVRVVGGAVRNSLMGVPVKDVDLATTHLPAEVMARAQAAGIKAVPTGIDHGTVTLVVDGAPFEVTTLRRDVATDGRHAEVSFGTDWQADAERRDFTVNALYADHSGAVIDPVEGLKDIETGTIRFIGEAKTRIAEDYLRVLRFFRFFAWYGRGRPDAEGLRASAAARDRLNRLSPERVWAEIKKLLSAENPARALLWMRQSGVLTAVLPETEKWGIDAIHGLVETEAALGLKPDPLLRLAAIVPDDAVRLAAMAERLRLSRAEAGFFQAFAEAPKIGADLGEAALERLLYRHGRAGILARLRLALASARAGAGDEIETMQVTGSFSRLLKKAETYSKPEMPVSGADILAAGFEPGPEVGRLLSRLEEDWVASRFSMSRDDLLIKLKQGLSS